MSSETPDSSNDLARKIDFSPLTIRTDDDNKEDKSNTIKSSQTLLTAATSESESTSTPLETPTEQQREGAFAFDTPEDQKINPWTKKMMSPTMLIDHDKAMDEMKADGMERESFYINARPLVKASIQYLYGLPVYRKLNRGDRLRKISKLVETSDSQERLISIVFALPKDGYITDKRKKAYVQMAVTSYLFGRHKRLPTPPKDKTLVCGGFPNKAIMLTQKGRNCFHPATVTWASMTEQLYKKHDKLLEAQQVCRRYLMKHPEELEGRVISNRGQNTVKFAKDVSSEIDATNWCLIDCTDGDENYYSTEELQGRLIQEMAVGKFGLVTHFRIQDKFQEAARLNTKKQSDYELGYFLFDVDGDGEISYEWVSYDHYKDDPVYKAALRALRSEIFQDLEEQDRHEKERRDQLKAVLEDEFPDECTPKISQAEDHGLPHESRSPSPQGSGLHAMTMISSRRQKGQKATFLCSNPWIQMPIVGVTAAYLRLCESTVCFCSGPSLSFAEDLDRTSTTLVADCFSYDVEGDEDGSECPKDWLRDAFGYTYDPPPSVDVFEKLYSPGNETK